jgi:hypothetical protein
MINKLRNRALTELLEETSTKVDEVEQQFETPISQQSTSPNNTDGVDGDRMVVDNGDTSFLAIKVNGRWMKTNLEEL